jgi:hypothetical protein
MTEIFDLEKKHKSGVLLIKNRGYYDRIVSEIQFLVKYIDTKFFQEIFSENLFNDMRGVFTSFVRQDLKKVFEEMQQNPGMAIDNYFKREYLQLTILRRCTTNLRYQVKSLVRMPKVNTLEFNSSFLQAISRKLNGEIQDLYRLLSGNYKQYFRLKFSNQNNNENRISFDCIDNLRKNFDSSFIIICNKFYQLSDAIVFIQKLFRIELENEIRNRIASIYFEKQEKIENVVNYFIDDLKKNFIKTIDRNLKNGHEYKWILNGFEKFIESDRFQNLLRKIILRSLLSSKKGKRTKQSAGIL